MPTGLLSAQLPPIVCFGNDWFADNRTSSHHIATELSRYTRVLYVGCPGLRAPQANGGDVRRFIVKLARATRGAVRVSDRLTVRTLVQWPAHGSAPARRLNAVWCRAFVRRALRREQMEEPVVWCAVPHVAGVAGRLGQALLVYYCIDDYAALPGVDAAAVRAMDDALTRDSDIVFAASQSVLDAKRAVNRAAVLSPHGVDFEHFASAWRHDLERPVDIREIDPPMVGFMGLIEHWIDLDLVGWLAREMPRVNFVMIGRIAVAAGELPGAPNLHFLGPRPYAILPAYGRRFAAAIIPYKLTPQVLAANPLKLREYLAMGLPVVSVSTPEIARFASVVDITRTRVEFRDALARAIREGHHPTAMAHRVDAVRGLGWDRTATAALGHVIHALERRRDARAP